MSYHHSDGYKILLSRAQVFDNFEADTLLDSVDAEGNTLREKFYAFVETYPGSHIDFDDFCNLEFIYEYKLKGNPYPHKIKDSIVGHSQTKMKFGEILQQGKEDLILRDDIITSLDGIIYTRDETKKAMKLKLMRLDYNEIEFGRKMTWSYVDDNYTTNFFENTDLKELPCVLGLPDPNAPRFMVSHKFVNTDELLQPTAFDAGVDNILWRPGGKTFPLDSCKGKKGKDEVVHKPNVFNAIVELEHNQ